LRAEDPRDSPSPVSAKVGLLAWGPFLFLHLEQFGNVARLSARADLPTGVSGMLVALGLALGLGLARHLPRTGFWAGTPVLLLAAMFFGRGLVWSAASGPLSVSTLVVTQLAGATLLARALSGRRPTQETLLDVVFYGSGLLLLFGFIFSHYAAYDIALAGSRTSIFLLAAAGLLTASILAPRPEPRAAPRFSFTGLVILVALAMLPLVRPFLAPALAPEGGPRPEARPGHVAVGEPIRAVSFNLHNGFDEAGGFALDEMLLALRREDADVVALQEVSRGWVINGSADLFELSREALGLPGVPGPSVTPDWGNAVFTRWPARASRVEPLPPDDLPLPRAVLIVDLEAPEDETRQLRILATHWHQVTDDHSIRNEQARFIVTHLEAPADTMPSLLLPKPRSTGTR
jgi:hypothetical protein